MATQRRTLNEFLEHPHRDSHRLELVDGDIYQKAPLGPEYESLAARLGAQLDEFGFAGVEARILLEGGPGWGPSAPIPDVAFYRSKPALAGDWPRTPPDLVVEILPPRRNRLFVRGRVEAYLAGGTGAVWIIDVDRRCVDVYERGQRRTLAGADRVTCQAAPGLVVPVSTLFVEMDRRVLLARAA